MSAPTYTLHYFDAAGRGEALRLAFVLCDIPFEDKRIIRSTEWPELKASGYYPYGQVPILEIHSDGATRVLAESVAIIEYIIAAHGESSGMQRTNPLDIAQVTEIFCAIVGINAKISPTLYDPDHERKLAVRKELAETFIPNVLAAVDKRIQTTGFVSKDTITKADLVINLVVERFESGILEGIPTNLAEPYKNIAKCCENVRNNPKIKAYYASKK